MSISQFISCASHRFPSYSRLSRPYHSSLQLLELVDRTRNERGEISVQIEEKLAQREEFRDLQTKKLELIREIAKSEAEIAATATKDEETRRHAAENEQMFAAL